MSAQSSKHRKRLFSKIEEFGVPQLIPCSFCDSRGFLCVMDPSRSTKCAVCQKRGHKCVNVSWESLDRTRSEKKKEVEQDTDELVRRSQEMLRIQREMAAVGPGQRACEAKIYLSREATRGGGGGEGERRWRERCYSRIPPRRLLYFTRY